MTIIDGGTAVPLLSPVDSGATNAQRTKASCRRWRHPLFRIGHPKSMEPDEVRDGNLLSVGPTSAFNHLRLTWTGQSAFTDRSLGALRAKALTALTDPQGLPEDGLRGLAPGRPSC